METMAHQQQQQALIRAENADHSLVRANTTV